MPSETQVNSKHKIAIVKVRFSLSVKQTHPDLSAVLAFSMRFSRQFDG